MKRYFSVEKALVFFKFFVTLILLLSVTDLSKVNSFAALAIKLLEFIIILELVRMIFEFVFGDDNRIKLRLMIDSTIVFFIRDIMLIVNDKFDVYKIGSILAIISILFLFRIISMKFSPSRLEAQYNKAHQDHEHNDKVKDLT